jgi:predicted nucleic acid-binding protein
MYLLDANAFMEANRLYYAFDIAPGFWAWLSDSSLKGQIGSIPAVKDEITAGSGALVTWAEALPAAFWVAETGEVVSAMAELALWANDPARQYRQEAVDEFMAAADLGLIAHAMVSDATVVTREQPAPDSKKRIKIPDVCRAFGVSWTDPFSVYRKLGLRLAS